MLLLTIRCYSSVLACTLLCFSYDSLLIRSLLTVGSSELCLVNYLAVDTDVDDAVQPKSISSNRVANPLLDDELGDRVVNEWHSR